MSEFIGTPGPWELTMHGDLIGSDGKKVVFGGDGFSIGQQSNPTWKANGTLAKAAPDLLEALRLCYDHCRLYHREVERNNVGKVVRSAIAKATGSQS